MKATLALALALVFTAARAQDSLFVRNMVDTLTAPYFWGRGYTNNGMGKAAQFVSAQFKQYGLLPLDGKKYEQDFSYPVNTFPGKVEVAINGVALEPGKDFILAPQSRGIKCTGTLEQKDRVTFVDAVNRIIIEIQPKLTGDIAQRVDDYTLIQLDSARVKQLPRQITVNIENSFVKSFKAANLCGYVKGTSKPETFIFFTAHYDHLGGLGSNVYFPGANDNASGSSVMLCLAQYYAAHPQPYSIGFISFAGEEAGLLGSKYFTEHPEVPLNKIKLLVNLDIEGTGDDGVTVVNATEFPAEFVMMQEVNKKGGYLPAVNPRGKAANSDHYFFTEKGVPAFFIYTLGGIKAYHDVYDRPETLPLTKITNLVAFLKDFMVALEK